MSASEGHWEPLAEIYLSHPSVKDKKKCIYCLCSRVFIKNYYDVYVSTLERGDSVPLISSMDPAVGTEQSNSPIAIGAAGALAPSATLDGVAGTNEKQQTQPSEGASSEEPLDVLDRAEVDDVFIEEPLVKQLSFGRDGSRKLPSKWGVERDAGAFSDASCYFSASASHSDTNYCSTDEHEHVFFGTGGQTTSAVAVGGGGSGAAIASSGLHSSDSGADLSERIHERKFSLKDELLEGGRSNNDVEDRRSAMGGMSGTASVERNNSLPEAFGREDLHEAWETYWSKHGEGIIWASWIEKYSDYINPSYLEAEDQDQATGTNTPHDKSEATPGGAATEADKDFSFDNDAVAASHTEIVVSACSPHPYTKTTYQTALWPLPGQQAAGGDELLWNTHRSGSYENEALLSPRCDSVTSSIPLTIGTTDSMTNVTRMTISSYDFCSSKVSSESSNLSESLSSEVSSDSSNSSDLLETEYLVGAEKGNATAPVPPDEEAAMDGEQYWQILWQQHFQELYAKHYHVFMAEHEHDEPTATGGHYQAAGGSGETNVKYHRRKRNSNNGNSTGESYHFRTEQLPAMVAGLRLSQSGGEPGGEPQDGNGDAAGKDTTKDSQNADAQLAIEDLSGMLESYGLPTAFGKQAQSPAGDGDDRPPPNDKPVNLKRSHESDTEETPKERLKAAFELMGYSFSDPANDTESIINITGEVVYRKKHIRLHNRVLKMKHHKPKHTYFDDDGNEQSGAGGNDKSDQAAPEALLHSSSDEDEANAGAPARPSARSSTILEYSQLQVGGTGKEVESLESGDAGPPDGATETPIGAVSGPSGASAKKEKKKKRKTKFVASLPADIANDKSLLKYWYKRFSLFALFDSGIRLDRESWFSVTPEKVAAHTAERCRADVIVDAFCGCGGNTIQFAFTCQRVIAIDIDPRKIEMAKHNAAVYGVADRIEFIIGDFMQLVDKLRADTIFLSPPWGGPSYLKDEVYDLEQSLLPVPASELMRAAQRVSKNVAMYLPRNSNTQQLTMLAGPNGAVEIEQNFLDRKLIALTAYYGDLINE
ncbi:hypothetical protein ZHAS_00008936 [Anopheles sinensis]|uniref:Trimethylguanosine synthase n=1 Tax=Anopheles sinensis TaxID=74873 RepID=A0A084VTR2_ANOSI|nr:hypothetical protein ZHAS_00008936 [Anopheles sinensis]